MTDEQDGPVPPRRSSLSNRLYDPPRRYRIPAPELVRATRLAWMVTGYFENWDIETLRLYLGPWLSPKKFAKLIAELEALPQKQAQYKADWRAHRGSVIVEKGPDSDFR